jgi:hypothetical protein
LPRKASTHAFRAASVLGVSLFVVLPVACGARSALLTGYGETETSRGGLDASDAPAPGQDADATPEASDEAPLCEASCRVGQSECDEGGVSSCVADDAGCGVWQALACEGDYTCVDPDGGASCRLIDTLPPRQIAPLSTSTVTSQRPTFHWVLAGGDDGARVNICRDRACTQMVTWFGARGTSGAPPEPLAPGVYFWRLQGREGTFTGDATSAVWEFFVPHRSAPVDTSWGTTFDFNGDGIADVAAGANGAHSGIANVYFGAASGLTTAPVVLDDQQGWTPSIASGGDVNGDGFADLVVGCGDPGQVTVYFGGPVGVSATPQILLAPQGHLQFGAVVQSAGDINGDGYADVFVSVIDMQGNGSAYLYLGGPNGLSPGPTVLKGGYDRVWAAASDLNGDGWADLVISVDGGRNSPTTEVDVYYGSPSGLSPTPTVIDSSPSGGMLRYINAVDAGDVNGDGYGDIIVSHLFEDGGALHLGGPMGLSASPIMLPDPAGTSQHFDNEWVGTGDINGDGFGDVLCGARGVAAGTAYIYYGATQGLSAPSPPWTLPAGASPGTWYASPIAGVGDVNGDGFRDVIIGSEPDSTSFDHIDYVYMGAGGGLSGTPGVTLSNPQPTIDDYFGLTVTSSAGG